MLMVITCGLWITSFCLSAFFLLKHYFCSELYFCSKLYFCRNFRKHRRKQRTLYNHRFRNSGFCISNMNTTFHKKKHVYKLYNSQLAKVESCIFGRCDEDSYVICSNSWEMNGRQRLYWALTVYKQLWQEIYLSLKLRVGSWKENATL